VYHFLWGRPSLTPPPPPKKGREVGTLPQLSLIVAQDVHNPPPALVAYALITSTVP